MKKGVLFILSGAPKSPEAEDVKAFLHEYWMDEWRNDFPFLFRKYRVHKKLLPKLSPEITAAYRAIWTQQGSPFVHKAQIFKEKVQLKTGIPVELGMRYGENNLESALGNLHKEGVQDLMVIPLYPQSSMSTTKSAVLKAQEIRQKKFPEMSFTFLNSFYKHPDYIGALAQNLQSQLTDEFDRILLVYENIPLRHDKKAAMYKEHQAPTYFEQCKETSEKVREALNLTEEQVDTAFFDLDIKEEKLQPDFYEYLNSSHGKLWVAAPSYLFDDWQSLIGIAKKGKEIYKEKFQYLNCLNDSDIWVEVLAKWLKAWNDKEN